MEKKEEEELGLQAPPGTQEPPAGPGPRAAPLSLAGPFPHPAAPAVPAALTMLRYT